MYNILVTSNDFGHLISNPCNIWPGCNFYTASVNTPEELSKALEGKDAVIAGLQQYTADILKAHRKTLRVISRVGSGTDNVDMKAAKKYGIIVKNTPNIPVNSAAELTVGLMINLLRGIHRGSSKRFYGKNISDCEIGIIGNGRIGSTVDRMLQAFNPRAIRLYDIIPTRSNNKLETVLNHSDVISLHIPLDENNKHFMDFNKISQMKHGSYIINTARGGVLDTDAAYKALIDGKLAGVAIDVIDPNISSAIIGHPNAIYTPHIGAHTREVKKSMLTAAIDECISTLKYPAW